MGAFPRRGKPEVMLKNQIEWITKLEVTLNDIKDLAEESAQMERDAYSSDMVHLIMSYFPNMIQNKLHVEMENVPDDGKIRLLKILDHIVKHRKVIQGLLKTAEGGGARISQEEGQDCLGEETAVSDSEEGSPVDDTDEDQLSSDSDEEHREEPGGDPPDA